MSSGFERVCLSLADLVGEEYVEAVCEARSVLSGEAAAQLRDRATTAVDFLPETFRRRQAALLPRVGSPLSTAVASSARGATSAAFAANTDVRRAPLSGFGVFRCGEDGRLYLIAKSEHYHASVGHAFPGYRLVDIARSLGVPNATHNNTRGHMVRVLEEELVRTAAGIARGDGAALARALVAMEPRVLNRVLNLETGSLAAEAAIKMVLGRFLSPQPGSGEPRYRGRTPVLVVVGDDQGGLGANYHGTTVIAQVMRGMWPELRAGLEKQELLVVRSIRPNDGEELEQVFARYDRGPYKIAGFFHELVLMNYGARRLTESFVRRAYELCEANDVPAVVDEIQSCIWSPELYLYREYGITPAFVVLGKGFSGGEYPASRILFSAAMDTLPQFGALVTNGQEELASLAYLITVRWAEANAAATRALGDRYEARLRELAARYPNIVHGIEGRRHLAGIGFHDVETGKAFTGHLNEGGIDISVQTYKEDCPPVALTKLPITAGPEVLDFFLERVERGLAHVAGMR